MPYIPFAARYDEFDPGALAAEGFQCINSLVFDWPLDYVCDTIIDLIEVVFEGVSLGTGSIDDSTIDFQTSISEVIFTTIAMWGKLYLHETGAHLEGIVDLDIFLFWVEFAQDVGVVVVGFPWDEWLGDEYGAYAKIIISICLKATRIVYLIYFGLALFNYGVRGLPNVNTYVVGWLTIFYTFIVP